MAKAFLVKWVHITDKLEAEIPNPSPNLGFVLGFFFSLSF